MTLHEVREFQIPLTVDHAAVVRHARRVARIGRVFAAAAEPPSGDRYAYRTPYRHVVSLALAMAIAIDLRLDPRDGSRLRVRRVRTEAILRAVWPAATDFTPMRDVIALDRPQYEAGYGGRCPVPGSRGGKCNESGRTRTPWVTDRDAGEWEWREMCDMHRPQALAVQAECPSPRPNRGGFLAAVFPDLDMDYLYEWAHPGWKRTSNPVPAPELPAPEPPVPAHRPVLRLVPGEALT